MKRLSSKIICYCINTYLKETLFYHGEALVSDNPLNPKFICNKCAKHVRKCDKRDEKAKRLKIEKRCLPIFMPSPANCSNKCGHIKTDIEELKHLWNSADQKTQCQFIEHIGCDVKKGIIKDIQDNFSEMK